MAASETQGISVPAVRFSLDSHLSRAESMSLDELAEKANAAAGRAVDAAAFQMCQAGIYLLIAKSKVEHGEWLGWLKVNWNPSQQHASRAMQLAEACGRDPQRAAEIEAKTVRGALAEIGKSVEGHGQNQAPRAGDPNYSRVSNLPDGKPAKPDVIDADFTVRGTSASSSQRQRPIDLGAVVTSGSMDDASSRAPQRVPPPAGAPPRSTEPLQRRPANAVVPRWFVAVKTCAVAVEQAATPPGWFEEERREVLLTLSDLEERVGELVKAEEKALRGGAA